MGNLPPPTVGGRVPATAPQAWRTIDCYLRDRGVPLGPPSIGQTTGGSHTATSLHYLGDGRDYGAGETPGHAAGCWRIYNALLPLANYPGCPIVELFWDPSGHGWDDGRDVGPIGGHSDHVHAACRRGKSLACSDLGTGTIGGGLGGFAKDVVRAGRNVAGCTVTAAGIIVVPAAGAAAWWHWHG